MVSLPAYRPLLARTFVRPSLAECVFIGAIGLFAIHFVDAAWVQGQPGAGLAEEALLGIAGLCFALASVLVFTRSSRLGRGLLAAGWGTLGILLGGPIHYAGVVRTGFDAGAVSGLILLPVGVLLLVSGAVYLFRAIPKLRFRFLAAPLVPLIALYALAPATMAMIVTHAPHTPVVHGDMGAPYHDVAFETSDGLTIKGWYVPSQNGAAVLLVHGSGGNRSRQMGHARMLVAHGYGVLVYDVRGHGESEGSTNMLGWGAWPDVEAAVAYLGEHEGIPAHRVGLLGLSMGAEIGITAAGNDVEFGALVADGASGRIADDHRVAVKGLEATIMLPAVDIMDQTVSLLSGTDLDENLVTLAANATVPTLFVAAEVPAEHDLMEAQFAAARGPKEFWDTGVGHTAGRSQKPAEYEERVLAWFDRWLLTEEGASR